MEHLQLLILQLVKLLLLWGVRLTQLLMLLRRVGLSNLLLLYLLKSCLIIEEKVIGPVNPIDIAIEKVLGMGNKEYPFSALFFK